MVARFEERAGDAPPPVFRFTTEGGTSVRSYQLADDVLNGADQVPTPLTKQQIYDQLRTVLGYTYQWADGPAGGPGGPGSVNRLMPMPDPQFPSLFADRADINFADKEGFQTGVNGDLSLAVPIFAAPAGGGFCDYNAQQWAVTLSSRPYTLFPNDRLFKVSVDYFDEDGDRRRLYHYREWLRYVSRHTRFVDTRVSASVASSMMFRAPGLAAPFDGIDNTPFTGIPDMVIPDTLLIFTWYGVPERYVNHPDSYLVKYRGYINQLPWYKWRAGQLLYEGCDVLRTYIQPEFLPALFGGDRVLGAGGVDVADPEEAELTGTFGANRVVDVQITVRLTTRTSQVVIPVSELPNGNWLAAGHNLLPHFQSRRFFYANANQTDVTKRVPTYLSVPFEILWQDPAFPENIIAI